jgi:GNAT superfamily N-acetyltransferase
MMALVSDAVQALGWRDGLLYLLARGLERGSRGKLRLIKYFLVAQPVPPQRVLAVSGRNTLEIARTHPSDPIVASFPRPPAVIERRFADGGLCFTAIKGGEFVGFLWLHDHPYEEDEVRCLFRPYPQDQAVWDYDVYVEPRYRAGRAFARLWDGAYDFLRARRIRWTLSRISAFNPGSLAAHQRMGARRVASAIFLIIGDVQVASVTVGPFLHVSWNERSRPEVLIKVPGSPQTPSRDERLETAD